MKKRYLSLLCSILAVSAHAQTYSHDDPKMKQITVQEIGSGALTPDAYYWALHNSYKKTAAQKNKLSYRTAAGIAAYQQVDDAEKLDSAMVKRAEVEALNVADRTGGALDLAWGVEGSKVTSKLETFETNIRRILQAGGTAVDQRYWQERAALFKTAIKATQQQQQQPRRLGHGSFRFSPEYKEKRGNHGEPDEHSTDDFPRIKNNSHTEIGEIDIAKHFDGDFISRGPVATEFRQFHQKQ